MDENERKLAKERKQQRKADKAALQGQEELILSSFLAETEYYFENGLRKVYPYYYSFTVYAKGRWYGSRLVDVFAKEFQNYTVESCARAVEAGTIQVNEKPTCVDHIIKNGDFILNKVHRHELPVAADPLMILVNNEEYLVIDKPASIPIHPCGRYRHNSLIYILAKEHGFCNLRTIHRLDRLTSGLVIFCKSETKTREMMRSIAKRKVEKEYLCQVEGQFPSGVIECDQPILALSQKYGIYKTDRNGKPSRTTFERIGYDGTVSVVKCKPVTGRTHQIRVHLQYLGFPIINDPLYKGPEWGPYRGKDGDFGKTDEELIQDLMKVHSSSLYLDVQEDRDSDTLKSESSYNFESKISDVTDSSKCLETLQQDIDEESSLTKRLKFNSESLDPSCSVATSGSDAVHEPIDAAMSKLDPSKLTTDENCRECKLKFQDPRPENLVMYLHAFRYKGPGWEFSTMLPKWATGIQMQNE